MHIRGFTQTIFGILTFIPGVYNWRANKLGSGGSYSARYCYSVYLRHIVKIKENNLKIDNNTIAELGPGDSLGIGLMALLLGTEKYYAFDVVEFSDLSKNLKMLDELINLLKHQTNIPNEKEYPRVVPKLDNYAFPSSIYSKKYLEECLTIKRINRIKQSLINKNDMIEYQVPWFNENIINKNSVDMIISQAVLEHIDDLDTTYKKLYDWLKKDGFMSHCIDFKSHGYANTWDGHWAISNWRWFLLRGKRPYLINRQPFSIHKKLLKKYKFNLVTIVPTIKKATISDNKVNKDFNFMTNEDKNTSGVFSLITK